MRSRRDGIEAGGECKSKGADLRARWYANWPGQWTWKRMKKYKKYENMIKKNFLPILKIGKIKLHWCEGETGRCEWQSSAFTIQPLKQTVLSIELTSLVVDKSLIQKPFLGRKSRNLSEMLSPDSMKWFITPSYECLPSKSDLWSLQIMDFRVRSPKKITANWSQDGLALPKSRTVNFVHRKENADVGFFTDFHYV